MRSGSLNLNDDDQNELLTLWEKQKETKGARAARYG